MLFIAKGIAGLPYFHKHKVRKKERKKESKKERKKKRKKERYRSFLLLLKYFTINAAIKQRNDDDFDRAFSRVTDNNMKFPSSIAVEKIKQSLFTRLNQKFCEDFGTML